MRRHFRNLVLTFIAASIWSAASAHVTVWPRTSTAGAFEKYTLRVPTEGKVATTSVELSLPADVTFVSIGAAVGHTYQLKKSDGRVVGLVWSMKINAGEFAEFSFMARNAKDAKQLVWKAVQKFADGTSTQWSGPAGDTHPASVTTLVVGEDAHAH